MVITCADYASSLSEGLRKVLASMALSGDAVSVDKADAQKKLEVLEPFFGEQLKTLKGMSRPVDDWIYDNIMQPTLGGRYSIKDAIMDAGQNLSVLGVSPHFLVDWRWYKDIHGEKCRYNDSFFE